MGVTISLPVSAPILVLGLEKYGIPPTVWPAENNFELVTAQREDAFVGTLIGFNPSMSFHINVLARSYKRWPHTWIELIGVENLHEIERDLLDIYYTGWESSATMTAALKTNSYRGCATRLLSGASSMISAAAWYRRPDTPPRTKKSDEDLDASWGGHHVRSCLQFLGIFLLGVCFMLFMNIGMPFVALTGMILYLFAFIEIGCCSCCSFSQRRDAVYAEILQQNAEHTPPGRHHHDLHPHARLEAQVAGAPASGGHHKVCISMKGDKGRTISTTSYMLGFYPKGTAPPDQFMNFGPSQDFHTRVVSFEGEDYKYTQTPRGFSTGASEPNLPPVITSISQVQPGAPSLQPYVPRDLEGQLQYRNTNSNTSNATVSPAFPLMRTRWCLWRLRSR